MRLLAVVIAAAFAVGAVSAAHAQSSPPKKRAVARSSTAAPSEYVPGTIVVHRGEDGRTRTKVLVQKRSYLDGGTEVMPADNSNAYRSTFLTHRATDGLGHNVITNPPGPIPDRFFLPGPNNPWPGFQF
jgi:hypothetical protein